MHETPCILVCLTTVKDGDQARALAQTILEHRAAACVQIDGPIESHYRWEGRDCCDQEYRLMIKTVAGQATALRELIRQHHPYDQPQIVTLKSIDVDAGYAQWVQQQTATQ
ncbi:divalent-cation tolerance protein CutA [Stieleria sp. TO1_6]|uniref:divalent-cation tolerance protein CutA n=1 Tax=Stieleria tagensis TaxID=2956795 RepID=UPI00209A6D10|nr:divalent-cation tolerance protein CutA [Stieleria tagensis]MCO8125192.1 divalent-cation tolerance protein CutA [Stieleria tagensis]